MICGGFNIFAEHSRSSADFVSDAETDEEFASARCRYSARPVICIIASADHRAVANPAPAFARQPTGGGASCNIAVFIDRNSAYCSIFQVNIIPAEFFCLQLFQLTPTFGSGEIIGAYLFKALLAAEFVGAFAG